MESLLDYIRRREKSFGSTRPVHPDSDSDSDLASSISNTISTPSNDLLKGNPGHIRKFLQQSRSTQQLDPRADPDLVSSTSNTTMAPSKKRKFNSTEPGELIDLTGSKVQKFSYPLFRKGRAPLESLPAELMSMILAETNPKDHLSLKLTSKAVAIHLTKSDGTDVLDVASLETEEKLQCHYRLEKDIPKSKLPLSRICCHCRKYKDRTQFSEDQYRKGKKRPTCVLCATSIRMPAYRGGNRLFYVNGTTRFICAFCAKDCHYHQEAATASDVYDYVLLVAPWAREELPRICRPCLHGRLKKAKASARRSQLTQAAASARLQVADIQNQASST